MEPSRINPYESPGEPESSSENDTFQTESRPGFLASVTRAVFLAVVLSASGAVATLLYLAFGLHAPVLCRVDWFTVKVVFQFLAIVIGSAAFAGALLSTLAEAARRFRGRLRPNRDRSK